MTEQSQESVDNVVTSSQGLSDGPSIAAKPTDVDESDLGRTTKKVHFDDEHDDFSKFEHAYINHYISLADTKAGIWFAIVSGALIYHVKESKLFTSLFAMPASWQFFFMIMSAILLVVSAYFDIQVILPRVGGDSKGLIFWKAVNFYDNAYSYARTVSGLDKSEITHKRLMHCYELAKVCTTKYKNLKISMWTGILGLLFLILNYAINNCK